MSDIDDFFEKHLKSFIPNEEEMEKISKDCYERDLQNKNNFSYWYPRIKSTPFKMANIIANKIFTYNETKNIIEKDTNEVNFDEIKEVLKPVIDKMENHQKYSIKNGTFSNKFDFKESLATKENLAEVFYKVNYTSALLGAGGGTEIVVRELIPFDYDEVPTIYNGLPLRPEFRVFYDCDKKKVLYTVNYWDYDYCYPNIRNKTDKIIFDTCNLDILACFNKFKSKVEDMVKQTEFDLEGKWSVDILYHYETDSFYLIDMAQAHRSAYWKGDEENE